MAAALAPAIESAGFRGLWVNDTPGADALALLEAAARVTSNLTLATGVIPVDRRSAASIADDVASRQLPQHRLMLGIGAGGARQGALGLVGDAASTLREELDAQVVVGALGPKMRRLAAQDADGVLLSWLTPEIARAQASEAHAVSAQTHVALYIRAALDQGAAAALHDEAARYASYPAYAANFERQGITAGQTVLDPASDDLAAHLEDYRTGPDEIVLRVITPTGSLEDHLRFIETAHALL